LVAPDIDGGVTGTVIFTEIFNTDGAGFPQPLLLFGVTVIGPLIPTCTLASTNLTEIEFPFEAPIIVAPTGTVHVYEEAPCTAATEYVKSVFNGLQIAVVPLIAPAPDGNALNVTVIELVAAVHGAVASVVNVNVTLPAA
jgi:hypothetical protein